MWENIETYISKEELEARIKELGAQITEDYRGKDLLLVGILKGSVVFMSDLMRAIDLKDVSIDFMVVSSYGSGTVSNGNVSIIKDLNIDISNRHLLIIEDILDTGHTLSKVVEVLKTRNPASVRIATLLNKPERRKAEVDLQYSGFTIRDEFVVGYGLDWDEKYRNLPYIGIVKQ